MGNALEWVGAAFIRFIEDCAKLFRFFTEAWLWIFRPQFPFGTFAALTQSVIHKNTPTLGLSALFTGMLLATQFFYGFVVLHPELVEGSLLSLTRDVVPVFIAVIVTLQASGSFVKDLGNMRMAEQIDTMDIVSMNSIQLLVSPRILTGLISVPLLTLSFLLAVGLSGYVTGVYFLEMDSQVYFARIREYLDWSDLFLGLIRAMVFGVVLSTVASFKGYFVHGGYDQINRASYMAAGTATGMIVAINYFFLP